jgi:hypothetical protein
MPHLMYCRNPDELGRRLVVLNAAGPDPASPIADDAGALVRDSNRPVRV